jgi:hypothetical protein
MPSKPRSAYAETPLADRRRIPKIRLRNSHTVGWPPSRCAILVRVAWGKIVLVCVVVVVRVVTVSALTGEFAELRRARTMIAITMLPWRTIQILRPPP